MSTDKDLDIKRLKEELSDWKNHAGDLEEKYARLKSAYIKYEAKSDNDKILYWRTKYNNLVRETKKDATNE